MDSAKKEAFLDTSVSQIDQSDAHIVQVLLPIPAERPYSYRARLDMELVPGDLVCVPLGPRQVTGVVWEGESDGVNPAKLRDVISRYDCPPLASALMKFVEWVANYTISTPGMVLRMVLRSPAAYDPPAPTAGLKFTGATPERLTPARKRVLELVEMQRVWTKSGLANAAGVSASVVEGMAKVGSFEAVDLKPGPIVRAPDPEFGVGKLSVEQEKIASVLIDQVRSEDSAVSLLDGVTGSGKTEIYLEAISEAFKNHSQVLVLLPEIALTKSFLDRFEKRFGSPPAEWHSDMTPRQREKIWRQVATGEIRVVVGARSALYLPFEDLGLIVVDEEHEAAFKQEDRVYYNARDMAVVRGRLSGAQVILSSATPSIESRVNADLGRYHYHRIETRFGQAQLPQIEPVDLRSASPPRGKFISPTLIKAIKESTERNEQALLFLNRRGYAPLTLCRACGHRFKCNDCSAWLVEHRFRRQLVCHHCSHTETVPEACPKCGTFDHLVACGPGIERLAEEVLEYFGDKRVMVLSSDMGGGAQRMRNELKAIADGEVDIVIGTQLVAKGHNFPLMTCVGVVDADLGLNNGDPRAAERTFQLLNQVTGRAGRAGHKSRGLIQTYQPDHPVIKAMCEGERERFYQEEIASRKNAGLPPFVRLAAIVISSTDKRNAQAHATGLRQAMDSNQSVMVLGPAEAPIAQVRGRFRFRLLLRAEKVQQLHAIIRAGIANGPKVRGDIRVSVDIDPQSFL